MKDSQTPNSRILGEKLLWQHNPQFHVMFLEDAVAYCSSFCAEV